MNEFLKRNKLKKKTQEETENINGIQHDIAFNSQ